MNEGYSSKYDHINKPTYDLITPCSTVLDIGCWNGPLGGALIKDKECQVDGVDQSTQALNEARNNGYSEIYKIDLNDPEKLEIKPKKYDFIVFADVLEHILHPNSVLEYYTKFLNENGYVIVSLPNIAFLLYRIKLLFGKFDYKNVGVMDKTYVKFYTLKTMKELLESSGFEILRVVKYNEVSSKYFLLQILKKIMPGLFTLQFIFLLKPKKIKYE